MVVNLVLFTVMLLASVMMRGRWSLNMGSVRIVNVLGFGVVSGSRIPMSTIVPALCLRGLLAVLGRHVLTGAAISLIMARLW